MIPRLERGPFDPDFFRRPIRVYDNVSAPPIRMATGTGRVTPYAPSLALQGGAAGDFIEAGEDLTYDAVVGPAADSLNRWETRYEGLLRVASVAQGVGGTVGYDAGCGVIVGSLETGAPWKSAAPGGALFGIVADLGSSRAWQAIYSEGGGQPITRVNIGTGDPAYGYAVKVALYHAPGVLVAFRVNDDVLTISAGTAGFPDFASNPSNFGLGWFASCSDQAGAAITMPAALWCGQILNLRG